MQQSTIWENSWRSGNSNGTGYTGIPKKVQECEKHANNADKADRELAENNITKMKQMNDVTNESHKINHKNQSHN